MSTKPEKEFHETIGFKAFGYTMMGIGSVFYAGQKTKKFVEDNMNTILITSAAVAATTVAVSMKILNDKEHTFPEKK